MKTFTKTTVTQEPLLKITHEKGPDSPRKWSNLGYFITVDRDYNSPDNHPDFMGVIKEMAEYASNTGEHIKLIKKEIESRFNNEKVIAIYPITKYDHSGVFYKFGNISGFDYSCNGFYIITKKSQKELGTAKKDFIKVINQELEYYNQFINGEIYKFILYDENGNIKDSCAGFYSLDDIKDSLPKEWQAENMKDYLID